MELPASLLRPLQQALIYDSDFVLTYPTDLLEGAAQPIAGKLASVQSTLAAGGPIVIVRARVADPASRLRDGEIVAVDLKLDGTATTAAATR